MRERDTLLRLGRRIDASPAAAMKAARAWLRVRDHRGCLTALAANATQRRFEERRTRRNIVVKARQMGMSTWVAGRVFLRTATHPGTTSMLVAQHRRAAEAMMRIVHRMWEELPRDLREGVLRRSTASAGRMVFPALDSMLCVGSASDASVGRGLSLQNLHCSEVAHWPRDAAKTLAGLKAALAPDGELVLESTPSGAYGAFYDDWARAVDAIGDEQQMTRHFFPWWMEERYVGPVVTTAEMREEEVALAKRHGLSGAQIGFRRGLELTYGALRRQEFAEEAETCFRATGGCCFDAAKLEERMRELGDPHSQRRGGALQTFLPSLPDREYVVAVDSAGDGPEGDYAAVQVIELGTGLQCAELRERLGPADLAGLTAEIARDYGGALVVVERNNHGSAVLAYLETRERYGRLYESGGQRGWLTSVASKPEMIARLRVLLERSPERFLSHRMLDECRSFVSGRDGRAGAAGGAHDDLVMAMAIAQSVRAELLHAG